MRSRSALNDASKRRLKPIMMVALALLDPLPAGVDLGEIEVDRLLAQHRLAGLDRTLEQLEMGVGGRCDQHRLDLLGS